MRQMEVVPGMNIYQAVEAAVVLAKETGETVEFEFNDYPYYAAPDQTWGGHGPCAPPGGTARWEIQGYAQRHTCPVCEGTGTIRVREDDHG